MEIMDIRYDIETRPSKDYPSQDLRTTFPSLFPWPCVLPASLWALDAESDNCNQSRPTR